MSMQDEAQETRELIESLRAEIDGLRAEVAELKQRAPVHYHYSYGYWPSPVWIVPTYQPFMITYGY